MEKIRLENVSFLYSEGTAYRKEALKNVNMTIGAGRITGLIGHTGSGKSTLVALLNGLAKPHDGRILLDGTDIWEKPKEIGKVRFRVGLVMQYPEYQLFEETVEKDIGFGPKNMGLSDEEIRVRVLRALRFVGLTADILEKNPFDLSGGQKRRVAIAGVIAMEPEVLVLDEPAAGLDPIGRDLILDAIRRYRDETGATVLIVSHSMEDMAKLCDDLVVLSEGEVILAGMRDEVFAHGELLERVGLSVPQITRLMRLLSERGVPVDKGIYTVDAAIGALSALFGKEASPNS